MNCERAGELIERRTGDGPLPFSLRLHIFRCPSCAAEAKRMKAAVLVLKGMLPRLPADFSDAVANALRGAPGLEAAPVSFRNWVIVGATMLAATGLSPLGADFGWIKTVFGSGFLLPLNIVLGLILTGYCALFIGTHLTEFADRLKLKHD